MHTFPTRLLVAWLIVAGFLSTAQATPSRWILQSNFWVSLHETLLRSSRNGKMQMAASMTGEDLKVWDDAVTYYRAEYADRLPLFDEELQDIGYKLSRSGDGELASDIPEQLRDALQAAAPVYRQRFWPMHERSARFWIRLAEALLAETADELTRAHEEVYGVPFPERVRVDVTPFAGRFGAYTTRIFREETVEAHVRISALDNGFQGFHALEALFHEASHAVVGPTNGAIGPELQALAERQQIKIPRQLWHAILFDTTGYLVRQALHRRGVSDYTPYSEGMFSGPYGPIAETMVHWRRYLDGEITRALALKEMVRAWETPVSGEPRKQDSP